MLAPSLRIQSLLVVAAIVAVARPPPAQEVHDEHLLVEVVSDHEAPFVGERFTLKLRVGIDTEFFASHALQRFARPLDVPVDVQAAWLDELTGTTELAPDDAGARGAADRHASFVLNDRRAEAVVVEERRADGRAFTVLEIDKSFAAENPGELAIAPTLVHYVWTTRFDDDAFQGRVPSDRFEASASSRALSLHVTPLPEQGRPADFTGAVGRFTARVDATPTALAVGDHLSLTLRVEGKGNLERFAVPSLAELAAFHLLGILEEKLPTARTIHYDLAVLEAVEQVPPIAFSYFDPAAPAGYRTTTTQPIHLVVRPAVAKAGPNVRATSTASESGEKKEPSSTGLPPDWLVRTIGLVVIGAIVASVVRVKGRRNARALATARSAEVLRPLSVEEAARADALPLPDFAARLAEPDADLAAIFATFLAGHLHCRPPVVFSPDLSTRLEACGVSRELSRRAGATLEALTAARYGGGAHAIDAAALRALMAELAAPPLRSGAHEAPAPASRRAE